MSKDRAKLGYAWRPAYQERRDGCHCPACAGLLLDRQGLPLEEENLRRSKHTCGHCQEPLWQADNTRLRRYPLAEYIKKYRKGAFDFLVADEVHELKGGQTAQGHAFGALARACGKTLALTGTLLGGYADDLFYVLYRLAPGTMLREEDLDYGQVTGWMAKYGVLERVTKAPLEDNVRSKGKRSSTTIKRKPGVSPQVFSRHLLPRTVFLGLADMVADLPPFTEEVTGVELGPELGPAYRALEEELTTAVRAALQEGYSGLLGTYLNALLSYPDRPFDHDPLTHPHTGQVIATPEDLPPEYIYPKERELRELVRHNRQEGRKVFVYCHYTGVRDVTARLRDLLYQDGVRTDILRSTVPPERREEWLRERVQAGTEVVLANPKLVQTGLDLYDFPSLAFYQTGYSLFTLRQAARRSWRIGQDQPVRVHYLYYRPTLQEGALQLMGGKLSASLALEGQFSEEGLLALTSGEDLTTALARTLVEGLDGEGVEELWARLNRGTETGTRPGADAAGEEGLFHLDPTPVPEVPSRPGRRRRPPPGDGGQLSLFGD